MTWPIDRITSRTKSTTNISARYKIHKKMENGCGGEKKKRVITKPQTKIINFLFTQAATGLVEK